MDPEIVKMVRFLDPEIVEKVDKSYIFIIDNLRFAKNALTQSIFEL